jgi:hypothetical protein
MKTILPVLIALLASCNPVKENSNTETQLDSIDVSQSKSTDGKMVYVTRDGDKYHTTDCRYAEGGKTVSLARARAAGRKACDVCKPNSDKDQKRCAALTADGTQCKRMTADASGKCFQHNK